jgi:hypothetical protein
MFWHVHGSNPYSENVSLGNLPFPATPFRVTIRESIGSVNASAFYRYESGIKSEAKLIEYAAIDLPLGAA